MPQAARMLGHQEVQVLARGPGSRPDLFWGKPTRRVAITEGSSRTVATERPWRGRFALSPFGGKMAYVQVHAAAMDTARSPGNGMSFTVTR